MPARSLLEGPSLVLGGTGFLGAHLVAELVAQARSLATFAEPYGPLVVGVGRAPELAPRFCQPRDAARWEALDLSDEPSTQALLQRLQPQRIFLAAALARAADCQRDPAGAEALNSTLPERVADWCASHSVRLIHISTDLVFGASPAPKDGFREEELPAPVSVYGESKARGEARLLARYSKALVVRLPLLYGDSGGRGLGASDALLSAVDRDEQPALFVDEFRTPLEVRNAARALVELSAGQEVGILHLAGPERISRYELGMAILQGMGLDLLQSRDLVRAARREDFPQLGPRPADVTLNSARARRLLQTSLLGVQAGVEQALR